MRGWTAVRGRQRLVPVLAVALLGAGALAWVAIGSSTAVPAAERPLFEDLDVAVSALGVASLVFLPKLWSRPDRTAGPGTAERTTVHVTGDLLTVLLDQAARAEPSETAAGLAVTAAGRFPDETGLDPSTPVFTHLVPSPVGGSTSRVFGMDLGVPPRETQGRFVSHPRCDLSLSKRDTLHEVVLVAVPPWDDESVAAFDRSGRRLSLRRVDASPPEERLPGGVRAPADQ